MTIDWRSDALCFTERHDPEDFSVVSETGPDVARIEKAKGVCRRCPVRVQCGQEAIAEGDETTVRGGMSPSERAILARRMRYDVKETAA